MAFKVTVVVESEEAGWIPAAINALLQRVARDQKVPAVYETEGPDGAKARLTIEETYEQPEVKNSGLQDDFFVN